MSIDFQKLQDNVDETRALVQQLVDRLSQPTIEQAPPEFLTVNQAAELLNLTPASVYGMVYEKRIPFSKPNGRLYFLRSDLVEWVRQGRKATNDELNESTRETVSNRIARRSKSKQRSGGRSVA